MYYYIMEPPRAKIVSRQEKIKDVLGNLGIAGETVAPSAARTIEELAHLGIIKGYSTIVAVGPESLVNKVITVLATQKEAKDVVLGIIPNDFNSQIAQRIGVKDLYGACNVLKQRKLETIDLCLLEPNKFFITEATIDTFFNQEIYFGIEKLKGKALTNKVLIKPGLEIYLLDKTLQGSPISGFWRWLFGKKTQDVFTSYFHTKKIRLESQNPLSLKVSGETIAKTPVTIQNRSRVLKIIVARDRMKATTNL
ncbi:MAG: DAGKc protein [Candidatus Berkelbacteria bacterium]|nr:DAGKc protein [Candidatus Berkelbacteria bacterium]